jgi:hypothetical protein
VPVRLRGTYILGVAFAVVSCGGAASKSTPSSGGAGGAGPTGGSGPSPHDGSDVASTGGGMGDAATDVSVATGGAGAGGSTAGGGGATGGATTGTQTTAVQAATGGAGAGGSSTGGRSGSGGVAAGGSKSGGTSGTGAAGAGGVTTAVPTATGGATMGGAMAGGSSATGGAVASGGATGGRSGTGGAATGGASTVSTDACSPDTTLTGGTQHCNQNASGSYGSYQWQLWSNTTTGCLTTYSDGAFSANWNSSGDLLAGVGLKFDATKTYQEIGIFSADFAERKTGTAGTYSYIGIHAWTKDPSFEIYIVEDSFNVPPPKPSAPLLGTLTVDGGTYDIYKDVVTSAGDSITELSSIRRPTRSCGHISISEHFAKWTELGVQLGKMQLVEVFVESGGGTGRIDFTTVRLSVD